MPLAGSSTVAVAHLCRWQHSFSPSNLQPSRVTGHGPPCELRCLSTAATCCCCRRNLITGGLRVKPLLETAQTPGPWSSRLSLKQSETDSRSVSTCSQCCLPGDYMLLYLRGRRCWYSAPATAPAAVAAAENIVGLHLASWAGLLLRQQTLLTMGVRWGPDGCSSWISS